MAIRIEVYVDEELAGEKEYLDRAEMAEDGVGKAVLDLVPLTEEEVDALSPQEKQAYLDRLMEELDE
jgi:hypothetical protein